MTAPSREAERCEQRSGATCRSSRSGWPISSPSGCCTDERGPEMEDGVAGPRSGIVLRADLSGRVDRIGPHRSRRVRQPADHRRAATNHPGAVCDVVEFRRRVVENWQSEYLQFFLYIYATVWLLQKGRRNPNPSERPTPPPVSKAEQSTRQRHGTNRNSAHREWMD